MTRGRHFFQAGTFSGGLLLLCAVLVAQLSLERESVSQESIFDSENSGWALEPEEEAPGDGEGQIIDTENPLLSPEIVEDLGGESASLQSFSPIGWMTGRHESRFFVDTGYEGEAEDVFLLQNRLSLRSRVAFSPRWTAVLEARIEHRLWGEGNETTGTPFVPYPPFFMGEHNQGYYEGTLRDAYISARFGSFFLKIGNQGIAWGAGTLTQPADVICPSDYRGGLIDRPGEQRLPVWAITSSAIVDKLAFHAVLVPFFEPHRFDLFGSDFALFSGSGGEGPGLPAFGLLETMLHPSIQPRIQDDIKVTQFPEALPRNSSAGLRVTSTYGGIDLGVGYFWGWDRVPNLQIDPDVAALLGLLAGSMGSGGLDFSVLYEAEALALQTAISEKSDAGEVLFSSSYRRRQTVEIDAVTYLGGVGLRLESAFTPERTVILEGFETVQLAALNSALSLSYESGEDLVLQLEGFYMHLFGAPDGRKVLITGEDYYGLAFLGVFGLGTIDAIEDTIWSNLSFRIAGLYSLSGNDLLLSPSAAWSFSDKLEMEVGAMFFQGPSGADELTLGGLYDANDQAYIALSTSF